MSRSRKKPTALTMLFNPFREGDRVTLGGNQWDVYRVRRVIDAKSVVLRPIRNDMVGWGG